MTPFAATQDQSFHKVRLRTPDGDYLHMSGEGVTEMRTWAWLGTPKQAAELQRCVENQGGEWPFFITRKDQ